MKIFLIIIFIIIVILILGSLVYINLYNKLSESLIRIEESEYRIDNNLRDKYDLLQKMVSTTRNTIDIEDDKFASLLKLKDNKISNFDFDRALESVKIEYLNLFNSNKKLKENDELYKYNKQLDVIDSELATLRNYYNANVTNYNLLIKKIPTNIIASIKRYKEKLYYDLKNMNDDNYKDFRI